MLWTMKFVLPSGLAKAFMFSIVHMVAVFKNAQKWNEKASYML